MVFPDFKIMESSVWDAIKSVLARPPARWGHTRSRLRSRLGPTVVAPTGQLLFPGGLWRRLHQAKRLVFKVAESLSERRNVQRGNQLADTLFPVEWLVERLNLTLQPCPCSLLETSSVELA